VASQGPNSPDSGTSASPGTTAWTNPGNVTASDNSRATCALTSGQTTRRLWCTDFDFSIPSGATIDGIEVSVERSYTGSISGDSDHTIQLTKDAVTLVGSNKAAAGTWPLTTDGIATYGGAADLWGTTWNDTEINATTFGVVVRAQAGASTTFRVDHVTITVTYTESPDEITPSGSITPSGALRKKITKPLAGAVELAGALATRTFTPLPVSGSLAPAGALQRVTHAIRRGTLTPAGTLRRDTSKALAGSLSPSGAVSFDVDYHLSLGGALVPSGVLTLFGGTPTSPELSLVTCDELVPEPAVCTSL
jgi:hypothetical protein